MNLLTAHDHLCSQSHCLPPSWQKHKLTAVMWEVVAYIRRTSPLGGVLENVVGFSMSTKNERSPLECLRNELQDAGYQSLVVSLDMSPFHAVTRQRSASS